MLARGVLERNAQRQRRRQEKQTQRSGAVTESGARSGGAGTRHANVGRQHEPLVVLPVGPNGPVVQVVGIWLYTQRRIQDSCLSRRMPRMSPLSIPTHCMGLLMTMAILSLALWPCPGPVASLPVDATRPNPGYRGFMSDAPGP